MDGDAQYVIARVGGGYLRKGTTKERINDINQAYIGTLEKANNFMANCFSVKERRNWYVKSTQEAAKQDTHKQDKEKEIEPMNFDEFQDFNWITYADQQHDFYNKIISYQSHLTHDLERVNSEIVDVEHYVEFFTLDAAKGYKAYKMLKERRIERRRLKDELFRIDLVLNADAESKRSGTLKKRIAGLETRQYEPRVLKELFNV